MKQKTEKFNEIGTFLRSILKIDESIARHIDKENRGENMNFQYKAMKDISLSKILQASKRC